MRILQCVVAAAELYAERTGEAVAKIVACAALQSLAVVHHSFDGVGGLCTGKLLFVGLFALQNGDVQLFFAEGSVSIELLLGFFNGLLCSFMNGVAFLPPELTAAQERARGFLPAHDTAPLIILHGQVAPRMQYMCKVIAEQRFTGGAHAQTVFQRLAAAHCHPSHFRSKALNMVFFLLQQAFGNKQRHCHVFVPGFFETGIQQALNIFPNGISVGAQNDTALHGGIVYQLCL